MYVLCSGYLTECIATDSVHYISPGGLQLSSPSKGYCSIEWQLIFCVCVVLFSRAEAMYCAFPFQRFMRNVYGSQKLRCQLRFVFVRIYAECNVCTCKNFFASMVSVCLSDYVSSGVLIELHAAIILIVQFLTRKRPFTLNVGYSTVTHGYCLDNCYYCYWDRPQYDVPFLSVHVIVLQLHSHDHICGGSSLHAICIIAAYSYCSSTKFCSMYE